MIICFWLRIIFVLKMADVLIIYASFGQGHKQAGLALSESVGAPCYDLLDFCPTVLKKLYSLSYIIITQHFHFLWRFLFFCTKKKCFCFCLDKIHRIIFSGFIKYLNENKPKVIITTHFFPPSLIAQVKSKLGIKVVSVITDLRVHPLWVNDYVDYYFVATSITEEDLIGLGVAKEKVISGFVPLRKGFLQDIAPEAAGEKFGLKMRRSVLFVSSIRGRFPYLKESINELLKDFNIFLIYGKNKKLKKFLEEFNSPNIKAFYFYKQIWELMSASFCLVTKPGGLTVFEGIYKKKAFIFTHYIPGHEKDNMDLLIEAGVAKFVTNKPELLEALNYFKEKYKDLRDYPFKVRDISIPLSNLIEEVINA